MADFSIAVLGKEMINQNGFYIEKEKIYSYPSHAHTYYEIILYEPFNGYITINGSNFTIDQPSVLFITPRDIHSTCLNGLTQSVFYKLCFESTEHISTTALRFILLNIKEHFDFFKQLCENALANKHNFLYLQTTIQLIVLELERNTNSAHKTQDKKSSLVTDAMHLINLHFTENITLESIAQQLSVTPQHLSSQFTKIAKITFGDYLKNKRLSYAANLLLNNNYNVTDACFASGYNNLSHFIRQFKKKYNKTPSRFNN